jgi:hypothetical protein
MAYMLPVGRYPDIRLAADPLLEDDAIEDATIASDLYLGAAERWALALDPSAGTRSGGEQQALYRAIIKRTAALIAQALPQSRQINMAGHTGTFTFAETPAERVKRLFDESLSELGYYLDLQTIQTDTVIFVTTVSGRRA